MKIKYCIQCLKSYLVEVMEDIGVGILSIGILESGSCEVIFSKRQVDFLGRVSQQKKQHFSFYGHFIFKGYHC